MRISELAADEQLRLQALRELGILDTEAEERFDRLTRIARSVFEVPIALVSLVDSQRQWFKSKQGLEACETSRDVSFCAHAILSDEVFYIADATKDPRFAANPLVLGPPHIRFYAGCPLRTRDGYRVGTLCVIDDKPRSWSRTQNTTLKEIAACVEHELSHLWGRQEARIAAEKQAHLAAVLDTVIDGIVTIDDVGIIQTVNPATERLFGYSAAELIGNNVKKLMPRGFAAKHDEYLRNYREGGEAKIIGIGREVQGLRRDGSEFPMELAVAEMHYNAQRFFVGIIRDISERKRIEQMKNQFISMVSHELRTPLTSIRGSLSLVLGKAREGLSPKVLRMLENANRNSERLTYLINDILDLEKIESGTLRFELAPVDLALLARKALDANEGYGRSHAVRLRLSCETSVGSLLVWGDAQRLEQVFANLISNAVKYSPPGADVEIRVEAADDLFHRVTVRDYGRGVPEEFHSRIFNQFAQADSSDSREKGGTGLGLSISKTIVERHGGRIGYRKEITEGAEFFFELPAWREVVLAGKSADAPSEVLICEDDSDVAFVLQNLLEGEGLSCDICGTAASAKKLLEGGAYRLLLLDLTLPDMDGLELLRELREAETTAELPVVIISGRADETRTRFQGDSMRVADWVQKPVREVSLSTALRRALRGDSKAHVLHVEDSPDVLLLVETLLEGVAEVESAKSLQEARSKIAQQTFDLLILDLNLGDGSGLELLPEAKLEGVPVVIFSGDEGALVHRRVVAALTKSKTTNEQLVRTIKSILNRDH